MVWIFLFLPLPEGTVYPEGMDIQVVRWLDLPIAVATQLVPCDEFAVDMWFRVRCPEPIGDLRRYFFNHMRIGIPVYLLLFYLPNIYRTGHNWWRRRRAGSQAQPGARSLTYEDSEDRNTALNKTGTA